MILPTVSPLIWVLGILALGAYLLPMALTRARAAAPSQALVRSSWLLAWALHAALIGVSLFGWGIAQGARFGFGPALSVTAWLVLTVYAVESRLYPQLGMRKVFGFLGALAVLVGLLFPGSLARSGESIWLPAHVALGVASYGLFAAAAVHAWLMTRAERQLRQGAMPDAEAGSMPVMTLERLMFALVLAGFVLLSATLLAGWLFGNQLYGAGHAWQWNHKTVFSLLSWCVFAMLLLGRGLWGWRGKRAVRFLYGGAALLMLGYVGSRFVLEVVLHRVAS
jgi:ABC-type uncharacterized transport system permease subunit